MASINERTNPLVELHSKISDLRIYGDNAVLRRVLTVVEEIMGRMNVELDFINANNLCRPDSDPTCRPDRCNNFALADWVHESQQDDRRRSIFLDPEEAFVSNRVDFLSGRLDVLEVRTTGATFDIDAMERKALMFMRGRLPAVTVNYFLAESNEEIIHALRTLANDLEEGRYQERCAHLANNFRADSVTLREECRVIRREYVSSRWINNGKTLQYLFRDILECRALDMCCSNRVYTKPGQESFETVWSEGAGVANPPPVLPPQFEESAWANQLPLLTNPQGTRLSSDWGWRTSDSGLLNFHGGIDIAGSSGRRVTGVTTGTVIHINNAGWAFSGVVVRTGERTHTYWHINPSVSVGDRVNVGDILGTVHPGNGTPSQRPHLHYAIHQPPNPNDQAGRNDGNSINPLP